MRILIDMDEVLVDLLGKSLYYYNKFYPGEDLKRADVTTWQLPGEQWKWDAIWRQPSFFMSIPPARGAERAASIIRELEGGGHECYCLSSPISAEAAHGKYIWFHSNFVVPQILPGMRRLILTRSKHLIKGDVLIDDGLHYLEPFQEEGGLAIAYDQTWNQTFPGIRVANWEAVPALIRWWETRGRGI